MWQKVNCSKFSQTNNRINKTTHSKTTYIHTYTIYYNKVPQTKKPQYSQGQKYKHTAIQLDAFADIHYESYAYLYTHIDEYNSYSESHNNKFNLILGNIILRSFLHKYKFFPHLENFHKTILNFPQNTNFIYFMMAIHKVYPNYFQRIRFCIVAGVRKLYGVKFTQMAAHPQSY